MDWEVEGGTGEVEGMDWEVEGMDTGTGWRGWTGRGVDWEVEWRASDWEDRLCVIIMTIR
ncbi:unnamed protein product, partial [Arctogadus glacialis]